MLSSEPLAYFLTWRTYGTWLPGDQRGWVCKQQGLQPPDERTERRAQRLMTETPCLLDEEQRRLVEEAIRSHCKIRAWSLHAVNCRSNHVHVVVKASSVPPDTAMAQLKAWSTRKLRARSASEGTLGTHGVSEG